MQASAAPHTLLLDMDGTILDLAFDNYFWQELIPRFVARRSGRPLSATREEIESLYAQYRGTLEWYCLDFWTARFAIDLRALKAAASQRIRYLPGARQFLAAAGRERRLILVTNAHGDTLALKAALTGLAGYFEQLVSAHELGLAKEQPDFWPALERRVGLDPRRSVLLDDSVPVLDAAAAYGLGATIAIRRPDSGRPEQDPGAHRSVRDLADRSLPALLG
ncbi:MAG: hypothetical protein D6727_04390 [Gammaproteobacteria bacterium]|nr:MAG: hypothetical protein D6727_04390 [Gammaproteobacteria bacterium]